MKLLSALLFTASSVLAAPVPLWGPTTLLLDDGAFAKEGLDTDSPGRCYSVGYETPLAGIHALLTIRDNAGVLLNSITVPPALMGGGQASCYAGVDAEANGAFVYAAGTHFPTGINGPATRLLVTKWTSAGLLVASNTMAAIPGLAGQEVWGCRVVISPIPITDNANIGRSVVFVSGCTEFGMFVLCLDKNTLAPVMAWGNNGAFSVSNNPQTSCPKHPMPGIFPNQTLFASCRQSFFEVSGLAGFLGGTLLNQGGNYEHTVAKVRLTAPMAGALVNTFNVQRYTVATNSGVKAMAVAGMSPATAIVALVGGRFDSGWRAQSGLPAFASQGQAFATAGLMPAPQTMNDVEMQPMMFGLMSGVFVHVGGKHNGGNGQVFTFWCPTSPPGAPAFNWSRNYAGLPDPENEVYDLAAGGPLNLIFAVGGTKAGGAYDAPLMEFTLQGAFSISAFSNTPNTGWPDRGNAALYHAGGTAFTHGNQQSTGAALWYGRNVRWNP